MTRIAFQGELGAYSHEALHRLFGNEAEPVPCRDFRDVGLRAETGEAEYGLLPIENSLAGSVVGSYDVLAERDLTVVGEVISPIHHCLLAPPGTELEEVRRVRSHPVALAQCTGFFERHPEIEAVADYDTAGAAQRVAGEARPDEAAIAGRLAAERYGLVVLAEHIEDRSDNQTRFLAVTVADAPHPPPREGSRRKTALLLETANEPGALAHVLLPFAEAGINLCKLESRPAGVPWTYRFFVEVEGDAGGDASAAFEEAAHHGTLRILGAFPAWEG